MSGRIKLMKEGTVLSEDDAPPLGYKYDVPSEFDANCGTYGLDEFQLPHPECPATFVCDAEPEIQPFSSCIDAMNCAMLVGMTTGTNARSEKALFMHQMIPHHQNAVNMAKALLFSGALRCFDVRLETEGCILTVIMHEIINNQNFQIQTMLSVNVGVH